MVFLLDTCVWVDVERGALAPGDVAALTANAEVYLSPVTLAELRFGAEAAPSAEIAHRRRAALARLERLPVWPIDAGTARIFGSLAAHLRAAGRSSRRRAHDLWLASQAIQNAAALLTRNPGEYDGLPGLDLLTYRLPRRA